MDEHAARRLRDFAEEGGRGLRGLDATAWRERMERRYRELETAFGWLVDHGQASDALAMAGTLAGFLLITDRVDTGCDWLDRALAAAPTNGHLRAVGLYERGMLAFWQGADEDACSLHGRSLQLARRLDDPTTVALALCGLARVALREDLDWARTLCEEALQMVGDSDDQLGRTNALHVLGMVERQLGNLGRAEHLATEALRIANRRGDQWLIPYVLNGLAAIAVETGAFERAATLLGAGAAMVERQGNAWPPDQAPHFEHSRAAVTAALDRQRLQRAWSEGRDMASADVVSYALASRPDPAPPPRGHIHRCRTQWRSGALTFLPLPGQLRNRCRSPRSSAPSGWCPPSRGPCRSRPR